MKKKITLKLYTCESIYTHTCSLNYNVTDRFSHLFHFLLRYNVYHLLHLKSQFSIEADATKFSIEANATVSA